MAVTRVCGPGTAAAAIWVLLPSSLRIFLACVCKVFTEPVSDADSSPALK